MIEQIMHDASEMEKEAIRDENDAQKNYEKMVIATNNSIDDKNAQIISKTKTHATKELTRSRANGNLAATEEQLISLSDTLEAIHLRCDFVLNNFEIRQSSRGEEIEALRQAVAILSGSNF